MDIEIFTLCDFAQDNQGKLTIVGTFDTVFARQLPTAIPTCHIALRLRLRPGEAGRIPFGIQIQTPDGQNVIPPLQAEMQSQVPPGAESVCGNVAIGIGGLTFQSYGRYSIILTVRGQELRTLPIFVTPPRQPNA